MGLGKATLAMAMLLLAGVAQAQTGDGQVTAYPGAFFAASQPYSAFDMLTRLPGFTFDPGDREIRGFGGATGNVLIDGNRPTSKQESLEAVLRRTPARSVERIELIRPGASGVDMQGRVLVANVVRVRVAEIRGRLEASLSGRAVRTLDPDPERRQSAGKGSGLYQAPRHGGLDA